MASEEPSSSAAAPAPAPAPASAVAPAPAPAEAKAEAQAQAAAPAPASSSASASASASAPAPAEPKPKKKASGKAKAGTKNYNTDPALWIYTSLTAGNMHIVTATSRLETILRANRVPFKAVDIAVDEKARMIWGRRAGKAADGRPRRLPGLVQMGTVLGDMVEIEEWNEYGELKQHVKLYYDEFTQPAKGSIAPVPKYKQPEDKAPHPPAALNPPPAPEREKTPAEVNANKLAAAVKESRVVQTRSVAEDAAERAKQLERQAKQARLKVLREKVQEAKKKGEGHGGGSPTVEEVDNAMKQEVTAEEKTAAAAAAATGSVASAEPPTKEMSQLSVATSTTTPATTSSAAGARQGAGTGVGTGLQSPTTGVWKDSGNGATASIGEALRTVQSPTTSSWVPPAESSLAGEGRETFAGAKVYSVSADEIAKVESQTMIREEPEGEDGTKA